MREGPQTLENLENNIRFEIYRIPPDMLKNVWNIHFISLW